MFADAQLAGKGCTAPYRTTKWGSSCRTKNGSSFERFGKKDMKLLEKVKELWKRRKKVQIRNLQQERERLKAEKEAYERARRRLEEKRRDLVDERMLLDRHRQALEVERRKIEAERRAFREDAENNMDTLTPKTGRRSSVRTLRGVKRK